MVFSLKEINYTFQIAVCALKLFRICIMKDTSDYWPTMRKKLDKFVEQHVTLQRERLLMRGCICCYPSKPSLGLYKNRFYFGPSRDLIGFCSIFVVVDLFQRWSILFLTVSQSILEEFMAFDEYSIGFQYFLPSLNRWSN